MPTGMEFMTNSFRIDGAIARIFLPRQDGTVTEAVIDACDLPTVQSFPGTWYGIWHQRDYGLYVLGISGPSKRRRRTLLGRFLLRPKPRMVIDYVNHDTLDHRRCNLRSVPRWLDQQNRRGANRTNQTSGLRGVHFETRSQRWIARLRVRGQRMYLGSFSEKEQAAAAVQDKLSEVLSD